MRRGGKLALAPGLADYPSMPSDEPTNPRPPTHPCMVCGSDDAPFGFDTRTGPIRTCMEHRETGEAVLVAPMRGGVVRQGGGDQR